MSSARPAAASPSALRDGRRSERSHSPARIPISRDAIAGKRGQKSFGIPRHGFGPQVAAHQGSVNIRAEIVILAEMPRAVSRHWNESHQRPISDKQHDRHGRRHAKIRAHACGPFDGRLSFKRRQIQQPREEIAQRDALQHAHDPDGAEIKFWKSIQK